MIRLINVSKYFVTPVGRHYVFRDVNIELPLDKNVGVIGPNGSGKSTFLRLLAGADHPSSGVIKKSGSISPPMGLTPVLQRSLSALENVRFAGRIYGMKKPEIDRMIAYVRELAGIGAYFEMPVETYSAGMRQKVAFGINMSMHFDYYLFDEISAGGDREFRKMAKAKVAERLRTSRFLMTSHDTHELLELCDAGIVIRDGKLNYFDDIRDAALFYGDDIEADGNAAPRRGRFRRLSEQAHEEGAEREASDEGRKRRRRKRDGQPRAGKRKAKLPPPETYSQLLLGDDSPVAAGAPLLPWQTPLTPQPVEEKNGLTRAEVQTPTDPAHEELPSHAGLDDVPRNVSRGT
jgi:capsular polysaccharide transport system ATP-binding protein